MTSSFAGFNVPVASVGSIDSYISAANRFPMLSEDKEFSLASKLQKDGDVEAARALVLSHLRLVIAVARGYISYGIPHADLIQEGNIGLMKAVKRFDPTRGIRLTSFAIYWIKAEIHEYILKNWRLVKVATTKAHRKLFFNLRSLRSGLGALSHSEVHDIAKSLDVKPEEVIEMDVRMSGRDVTMEGDLDDDGLDPHTAPIHWLSDTSTEPTEVIARNRLERFKGHDLHHALMSLDDRSRDIVQRRWLSHTEESPTLHDLASEYGVSAERIRQIEASAMKKMKKALTATADLQEASCLQ